MRYLRKGGCSLNVFLHAVAGCAVGYDEEARIPSFEFEDHAEKKDRG